MWSTTSLSRNPNKHKNPEWQAIPGFFSVFRHFVDAVLAHILPAVGNQTPGRATENTGRLKLLQDDPVILHVDFQFVPLFNIQGTAKLDGQNNSAKIINLSDDSGGFHGGSHSFCGHPRRNGLSVISL
jgi:hypothetical protein